MKTKQEILDILNSTPNSEGYHAISPMPGCPVATDGVIALAEAAWCHWLLDVIGSHQRDKRLDPSFQVWKLEVNPDRNATVRGYNDMELIVTQSITATDFPLDGLKLFVIDGVIMLPSEY